ncbi:hypothetical protein JCM19235_4035 [Vibrio maritimus]|uniref:Uncharacterized protein n=1 Tax=Vibrio maritimus TaxID=990268 RepID=A0A090S7Q7_9VIBR|nr:hypothetical protein JCM19235_4035 [Vibrio maritimus]
MLDVNLPHGLFLFSFDLAAYLASLPFFFAIAAPATFAMIAINSPFQSYTTDK